MTTETFSRLSEDEQKALAHCIPGSNRAREPFGWDANTKAAIAEVEHILSGRLAPRVNEVERMRIYIDDALDAILTASADNGGSYTCAEANRIAELFELVKHEGYETFLLNHAEGDDDPDDLHRLCQQCREAFAEDYDMCGSCLHDAKRSGWEPGTEG